MNMVTFALELIFSLIIYFWFIRHGLIISNCRNAQLQSLTANRDMLHHTCIFIYQNLIFKKSNFKGANYSHWCPSFFTVPAEMYEYKMLTAKRVNQMLKSL